MSHDSNADHEEISVEEIVRLASDAVDGESILLNSPEEYRAHLKEVLHPREYAVLDSLYFHGGSEPKTLEEVGELFGVTPERIRQIRAKAINKLLYPNRSGLLIDFLEDSPEDQN